MQYFTLAQYANDNEFVKETKLEGADAVSNRTKTAECADGGKETETVFTVQKNLPGKSAVRLVTEAENWDEENYIFAPAALYNGNKFKSVHREYPPMLTAEEIELYKGENIISDVPRLSVHESGKAQIAVGDLSAPCFGYFSKAEKRGHLLFFKQENELGNFGVTVEEDLEHKTAKFILSSPCMRTPYKYGMCTTQEKTDDVGADLKSGDKVTFSYREYVFPCEDINAFLNKFFSLRNIGFLPKSHPHRVPWHYAFRLIENKYNVRNWRENYGFYASSEASGGIYNQWQTGWVGGAMNTLPGMLIGTPETTEKSRKTLQFVFDKLQDESGFLYGIFCNGRMYGDNFLDTDDSRTVMSRKNADALYYIAKTFLYLREQGEDVPAGWKNGLRRLADAFVEFYRKNGEIGQLVNMETMTAQIHGTASGGLISAALALSSLYFDCPAYLEVAEEIGEQYYNDFVKKGYTTGGPGEILACPDSESAYALLESYVMLYRTTKKEKWLQCAKDTASICASWCVAYDYTYKKDTQFYERGVASTGVVWASVQNKHAAPGICTMSGESFLHLYRATGDVAYLEILKDIAHNITQFVSTPENPCYASYVWHNKPAHRQKMANRAMAKSVFTLSQKSKTLRTLLKPISDKMFNPVGRINERVNLSDWEGTGNVGELPIGSCWCEVSAMLTYLEIPAVYIRPAEKFCFALDHIEAHITEQTANGLTVEFYNPTQYDCDYRIFTDTAPLDVPMPLANAWKAETVSLHAGERKTINIQTERGTENV